MYSQKETAQKRQDYQMIQEGLSRVNQEAGFKFFKLNLILREKGGSNFYLSHVIRNRIGVIRAGRMGYKKISYVGDCPMLANNLANCTSHRFFLSLRARARELVN